MSQSLNAQPASAKGSTDHSSLHTIPGLSSPHALNSDPKMSSASSDRDTSPRPPAASSSGISDIERLEHLKKEILEGQNPIYKANPQPSFLESLYLGRLMRTQSPTPAPAHPDQVDARCRPSSDSPPLDAKSPEADAKRNEPDHEDKDVDADPQERLHVEDKAGLDIEQGVERKDRITNHVESITPAIPSVEPKSTQLAVDRRQSYSPGVPTQGATADTPGLPQNAATDGQNGSSQRTTLPDSSIMTVQTFSDGFEVPHGPLSAPLLTDDPPYDPKESLSHLKNASPWFDDRTSYVVGPYASGISHSPYALDNIGGKPWNSHYGYRFEDHPYEADNHRDHFTGMPMTEPSDSNFREPNRKESKADPSSLDASRLASSLSTRVFRSPVVDAAQTAEFAGAAPHPSTTDLSSGLSVAIPGTPSAPRMTPPSTSGPLNRRSAAPGVYQPFIEQPQPDVQIAEKRIMGHQLSTSEGLVRSLQTSEGLKRSLQERLSDPSPTSNQERNGNRMSLQERISSPPVDRSVAPEAPIPDRSANRPTLEERMSSGPSVLDTRGMSYQEPSISSSSTSVAMALSIIGHDQRITPVSPITSSAISDTSRIKVEDQHLPMPSTDVNDRIDLLQPHHQGRSETLASLRGKAPGHQNGFRIASFVGPDAMLIPSPAYRDKRERRYTGEKHSFAEAGHYERPLLRERDSAIDDRAGRPSLEAREWRERDVHLRTFVPRADAPPSPARVWTANTRNGGQPEPHQDSGYYDREYDRRASQPPRSWDREDAVPARPQPEVYPPAIDIDREWYPPGGARERPRIRGRSSSPNPMRRNTYGPGGRDFRPAKRVRDETYYEGRDWRSADYYDRQISPQADYYGPPDPYMPGDVHDPYLDRSYPHDIDYYERRPPDMGPASPRHAARTIYTRPDVSRYDAITRTA